jgi:hypothetical protein
MTMTEEKSEKSGKKRAKISQADVPAYSLEDALRIPLAIADSYGCKSTKPLDVAAAMSISPGSSQFRMLTGAAIAYGLTAGGYHAPEIELTPLGKRIVRPTKEKQDLEAKREALLKPRVISEFLNQYNGSPIPKDNIAQNVLVDMGVPAERAADVLALVLESAEGLGLIQEIKGRKYVNLSPPKNRSATAQETPQPLYSEDEDNPGETPEELVNPLPSAGEIKPNRRVFVTHGKSKTFVEPIRKLLSFGEMEAVVSVERQSVSQPVPDKVMNDMRSCGAAIIHVEDELRLIDKETNEHIILNPNVLIEIGAAMALYRKRFILLVKEGVTLPSNLQGLYEVRYTGDVLDGSATIRLLEAINELKKQPQG